MGVDYSFTHVSRVKLLALNEVGVHTYHDISSSDIGANFEGGIFCLRCQPVKIDEMSQVIP
tara:strand:- start:1253 stop:1435 length:183 start_codon:yes stop_codon:yes gene_type:complete